MHSPTPEESHLTAPVPRAGRSSLFTGHFKETSAVRLAFLKARKTNNILTEKISILFIDFLYLKKNKAKKRPTKYNVVGLFENFILSFN